jgi:type VI secretion system secreted protein VgrG
MLVVAVETFGAQHEMPGLEGELDPFGFPGEGRVRAPAHENRFRAVPATVRFRPERRTARPRIHGVHRAVVTSEEHGSKKEVNTNRDGDVRLRFPWDDRPTEPGVASSNWVPVTNPWSGTGYGAMHTPRVGQTMFAAFDDGDPDKPVALGGYYSEQTPAPYNPEESPGVTGLKSWSTPDAEGSNEIRMDDAAGDEALDLHAQKDMSIDVENDQEVTVGNDLSVEVINDYDLDVGSEVDVDVGGMVDVRLHDDLSLAVDGDAEETFGGDLTTTVTGNRQATVKGDCAEEITGDKYIGPKGDFTVEAKDVSVGAMEGKMVLKACSDVTVSGFSITAEAVKYVVVKAPNVSLAAKDLVQLGAAEIGINADHVIRLKCGGSEIVMRPGSIEIKSAEVIINGSTAVKLNC